MRALGPRLGRAGWISLAVALAWSAGLVIAAMVAPMYSSSGGSGSGTATLVGVNGWAVLLVVGAPLVAAALTAGALWRRADRAGAGVSAWVVTGLLACLNVLALLSIGVFILPVTIGLIIACATHGSASTGGVARARAAD